MRHPDFVKGEFVTVTIVRITPDLGLAKVYLSFLKEEQTEVVMEHLEEIESRVRHALAQRVRHQLRKLPELHFFVDDTQQEVARIEKLLGELDIPSDEADEKE